MDRILMVVGSLGMGGAETLLVNLLKNIDREQIMFDFVCLDDGAHGVYEDTVKELGSNVYHLPKYKIYNSGSFKKAWREFFEEHKEYKIIHTHHSSSVAIILKIAKEYGLYCIAHSHSAGFNHSGLMGLLHKSLTKKTRKVADHFFTCSHPAAVAAFGKEVANDPNRLTMLNNGILTANYRYNPKIRKEIRQELRLDDDVTLYSHVGRFTYQKNHKYLLKVFAETLKKDPKSRLLLLGEGELKSEIMHNIETLGIDGKVFIKGIVMNPWDYLQAADYFVFPSFDEGLPLSVVEAQASGLKVLMSDHIADETVVTDLVEKMSIDVEPALWADKLIASKEYKRRDTYDEIVKSGFDISSSAKFMQDYYTNLLKELSK